MMFGGGERKMIFGRGGRVGLSMRRIYGKYKLLTKNEQTKPKR